MRRSERNLLGTKPASRGVGTWEVLGDLGEGGQSKVFLVRGTERQNERGLMINEIRRALREGNPEQLAQSVWTLGRSDKPEELGALKVFNIGREDAAMDNTQAMQRLKNEITALQEGLSGMPKLLDFDEEDGWIVTEYFPHRSLKHNLLKYRGVAIPALKAFRHLVATVVELHKKGYVHRDIKPANVFVRNEELVLGDFGIVFIQNENGRVTRPIERVGPRDYMPPWTNLGEREESVSETTDIYMLGKLLWTLVDGRPFLPYQYQQHPKFDLTVTFQGDPHMHFVNQLLRRSVVEHEKDCTMTGPEMLMFIDKFIQVAERGGQILRKDVPRPCRICGDGFYVPIETLSSNVVTLNPGEPIGLTVWAGTSGPHQLRVYPYACSYCGHTEFFTKGPPA
jgi:serine/threonine protein kinase